jgi:anti-sigma B factor antagonist
MDIQVTPVGSYSVVRCEGRLDMSTAARLRDAIEEAVTPEMPRLVVDLTSTPFVDSSGLGVLVGGLKRARLHGGDLRIAGAGEPVRTVLRLTKLDQVLREYPTVDAAAEGW